MLSEVGCSIVTGKKPTSAELVPRNKEGNPSQASFILSRNTY